MEVKIVRANEKRNTRRMKGSMHCVMGRKANYDHK